MAKTPARYSYRNKKNGNVIRISSELTSPDWELIEDSAKASDASPEQAPQEGAETAPEGSKASDTSPAEKPAEANAAAKKKAPAAAAKKSTGKKV